MDKEKTNENLVNKSNQPLQEQTDNEFKKQKLVNKIDKLLLERLPDYIDDELKWIRKEYGNDEISEFFCGDSYYLDSILLKKIKLLYVESN